MPFHQELVKSGKNKGKYVVKDDKGKQKGMHDTKREAVAHVTAGNIGMGLVPGVKPRKKK